MSPFEPLDGSVARWRMVHEQLRTMAVGDVFTYAALSELLDLNDRHAIQSVVRRAAKEFEKADKHALAAVPNVGYRIVEADEHVRLARTHQAKSSRSLVRSRSKVSNVDYNDMSPEVRAVAEAMVRALSMQMEFNRRMDIRQSKLEEVVESVAVRTNATEDAVKELKDRLARLEAGR